VRRHVASASTHLRMYGLIAIGREIAIEIANKRYIEIVRLYGLIAIAREIAIEIVIVASTGRAIAIHSAHLSPFWHWACVCARAHTHAQTPRTISNNRSTYPLITDLRVLSLQIDVLSRSPPPTSHLPPHLTLALCALPIDLTSLPPPTHTPTPPCLPAYSPPRPSLHPSPSSPRPALSL